jgi:tRNA modification GTPase
MLFPDDTIAAVATPPGRGGLGVVRISGPAALPIAQALLEPECALIPRHATLTRVAGIDRAVVTFFRAPHSYTGEDVVELSLHGNPLVLAEVVSACVARGARLAGRGEFTLRAFLNGRIDLVQAEAVGDLIAAVTPLQARAAFDQLEGTLTERLEAIDAALLELVLQLEASLDFPEEGYRFVEPSEAATRIAALEQQVAAFARDGRRGRLIREGCSVAIGGRPNVGKSSLFNRLAGADRAIVTDAPGTTRDLVTELVDVGGLAVTLIDTAGLREVSDPAEAEGVRRARRTVEQADLLLVVLDRTEALQGADRALLDATRTRRRLVVANKHDGPHAWEADALPDSDGRALVEVSARDGSGLEPLRAAMLDALGAGALRETALMTNARQLALIDRAAAALRRAGEAAAAGAHEELVLADLHDARAALEEVTGKRSADDLLAGIFDRFCIGK